MRSPSILLFFAAAVWGLYWLPVRQIEALGLSGTWSVAFFNACPLIVMIPYLVWNRKTQIRHMRAVIWIAALTGTGLAFYASGLVISTVIRTTLLFYLTPIWSTIIGVIWLSETLHRGRVIAIVLGLVGLWLLLAGNGTETVPLNIGDLFALMSGVFWGFGAACIKKWPEAPTATTTTLQFVVTLSVCILIATLVFNEPLPALGVFRAAFPIAFIASTLAILPSVFVIFWASKRLFPGRVGILMLSEALVAILSASLLLPEETMTLWQWVGGGIIITACLTEIIAGEGKTA
ncbi:MAG: DMT family transporter [Rhodobacteraceae bacterium]|nr:DMT family transporter [Paracoccaceae bacterium]